MTHLFDTTAVLVLMLQEPGVNRVHALFDDDHTSAAISVLTKAETWARLKNLGRDAEFEEEWNVLLGLFDAVLPVDGIVVDQSIALRRATRKRLPTTDSLIAATAKAHGLVLVHRDSHFLSIPPNLLATIDLSNMPET